MLVNGAMGYRIYRSGDICDFSEEQLKALPDFAYVSLEEVKQEEKKVVKQVEKKSTKQVTKADNK